MKHTNKKAFTLVELVIVIAVIAILAAVLIPTFASLIKRANTSADEQAVKQMNIILAAEEAISGKPATVVAAKEILSANGVKRFTTFETYNAYYWVGSENRIVLWTWDEAVAPLAEGEEAQQTGKVTYPKDLAKAYAGYTEPSADWDDLGLVITEDEGNYIEITVEEGETLKDVLIGELKNAPDGAIIKLPENTDGNFAQGGLYWLGQALADDGHGQGKHITIDLNGNTLESSGTNAVFTKTEDGTGYLQDADGYVMNVLEVPVHGELILANGSINIQHGDRPTLASFMVHSGGRLVLRDIDLDTTTAGVMPAGDASEVVIENSTINALNYALGTNRMESNNLRITVANSTLSSTYATTVLINAPSFTVIRNSTITGIEHGIAIRTGHIELYDSNIITTETDPGIYSYDNFASGYNFGGWWGTGNTIPAGTIVAGDYAKANSNGSFSYAGNVEVELYNTKLESAAPDKVPTILLAASDPAKNVTVTYDDASSAGVAVVYGSVWNPTDDNVDVTFNHPGTMKVNGVVKTLN